MNTNYFKKLIVVAIFFISTSTYWLLNRSRDLDSTSISKRELTSRLYIEAINENQVNQESDDLVQFVREHFIVAPSGQPQPYNLIENNTGKNSLQAIIIQLLDKTRNGFFVEVGAHDGKSSRTTLYLEQNLGWSGLLIEPAKRPYKKLRNTNRKSWISNVAVSTHAYSRKAKFYENSAIDLWGGLSYRFYKKTEVHSEIQCIPLYTLILAMNRTSVDFLSLDIEGAELEVLRTIPFDKLKIKAISVEVNNGKEGPGPIKEIMEKNGFKLVTRYSKVWVRGLNAEVPNADGTYADNPNALLLIPFD